MSIKTTPIKTFVCSEYDPVSDRVIDKSTACRTEMDTYIKQMDSKGYVCESIGRADRTRGYFEVRCSKEDSNQLILAALGLILITAVGAVASLFSISMTLDPEQMNSQSNML